MTRAWLPAGALALLLSAVACDALLTRAPEPGDVFDGPVDGLTPSELAAFVEGDGEFGRAFAPADGLGPVFNNVSCASCHSGDGRGRIENALSRFGEAPDFAVSVGGPQLQDRAIAGAEPERLPSGYAVSVRLPPPVFGVGLIEAIPDSVILAYADSLDADGDGISGRPNYVVPPDFVPASEPGGGSGSVLGRFSRKAQVASLLHQVAGAYHEDMGITSDFLPVEVRNPLASAALAGADRVPDPEVPTTTVQAVVNYVRMLAPPAPGTDTPERARGAFVFDSIGCAQCHRPTMRTGTSPIGALSQRDVTLYSDLLLHDMGPGLADNRGDGGATGSEWRTAPLWGLRLMREFLNGDAFLLHDGRARTIEEAILLHGGEAQAVRDRFAALPAADRSALLDFVGSR
jgi:CxxC motif-containing protein (DUF1111 family)